MSFSSRPKTKVSGLRPLGAAEQSSGITYGTDYYQRITLESWLTNRCQQLPEPDNNKTDKQKTNWLMLLIDQWTFDEQKTNQNAPITFCSLHSR